MSDVPSLPELPPHKPHWDRPPAKDKGDSDPKVIYQSVGVALTGWEYVETAFARLFGLFIESNSQAAARAYGAIASHSGRREALENAAEVFFALKHVSEPDQIYFGALSNHFKEAGSRRNEIAHGRALGLKVDGEELGIFLYPAEYNSRKTSAFLSEGTDKFRFLRADYRYTSEDIIQFSVRFAVLYRWAEEYWQRIAALHHR